jgi:hypothetical protein
MVDVKLEFVLFKADFDKVEKIKQTNNSEFKTKYQEKQIELDYKWFTSGKFIDMLKKLIDPNEGLFNLYKKKGIDLLMQTGDTIPLPGQPLGPPNDNFIFKRCVHKPCTRENPQHILESIHPGELNVATVSILGHNIRKMVAQLKKPQSKRKTYSNPYRIRKTNPAGKTQRGGKRKRLTRKIKRTKKTRTRKTRSKRAKTQKHRTK